MKLTYVEGVGIKKLEQYEKTVEFVDDDGVEDQVINVYPQVICQSFEGFGGAITDAAGYVFQQLDPERREQTSLRCIFSSGPYELPEGEDRIWTAVIFQHICILP